MSSPAIIFIVVFLNFSVLTESYSPDTPIKMSMPESNSTEAATGIEACLKAPMQFNARVYAVQTSDGSEFIRHFVNEMDQKCFDDSAYIKIISDSADFAHCAEATAALMYNSFTYDEGLCTAYRTWRPKELSTCFLDGTGIPVYVVETKLSDFDRATDRIMEASFEANSGDLSLFLEMYAYDPCHEESDIADYVIKHGGSEVARVPYVYDEMQNYTDATGLCTVEDPLILTITAVDANGNDLSDALSLIIPTGDVDRVLNADIERGVSSVELSMLADDPCQNESIIVEYIIEFQGSEVGSEPYVYNETQYHVFSDERLCSDDDSLLFTITAVDANGDAVADPVDFTVANDDYQRILLTESGNCVAIMEGIDPKVNYDESKQQCDDIRSTMFTQWEDGEFAEYAAALANIKDNTDPHNEHHFVYLRKNGTTYTWQDSYLDQPLSDTTVWKWPNAGTIGDCARSTEARDFLVKKESCDTTVKRVVCFERLTPITDK